MTFETRECPLCPGQGAVIHHADGSFDQQKSRYAFQRRFYRCEDTSCDAVYFYDVLISQTEASSWQADLEECCRAFEAFCREQMESEPYQQMRRAEEENDTVLTKDRNLRKLVREIDKRIAAEREKMEDFLNQMRRFSWVQPEELLNWVESNQLPPNFVDKDLNVGFRMSQPSMRHDFQDETPKKRADRSVALLKRGQSILHRFWGEGRVVRGNSKGGSLVTLEFPEQGRKTMDLRYAKLLEIV